MNVFLDHCDLNDVSKWRDYSFVFEDKTMFDFILLNLSNGYYDGCIETQYNEYLNIEINKLVILVGLPGSGKTTYAEKYSGTYENDYIIYDDELFNLYKIKKDLYNKKKVIVISATFCNMCNYLNFIEKLNIKYYNCLFQFRFETINKKY